MIDNKYDESLLLLLELADKYIDVSKIGQKSNRKPITEDEDVEEKVNTKKKIEPEQKRVTKDTKIEGEDAEYMLSVLVGDHFASDEEIKETTDEVKKKQDEKNKQKELNEEEKTTMEKTQVIINNSHKNNGTSAEKEKEDVETLLQIMDIYMDIYKP